MAMSHKDTVENVVVLGDNRGLSNQFVPRGMARDLEAAAADGFLKRPCRGWGWRLTTSGKALMAEVNKARNEHHAALESAGFDPNKKLSEMTPEEILAFVAWNDSKEGE